MSPLSTCMVPVFKEKQVTHTTRTRSQADTGRHTHKLTTARPTAQRLLNSRRRNIMNTTKPDMITRLHLGLCTVLRIRIPILHVEWRRNIINTTKPDLNTRLQRGLCTILRIRILILHVEWQHRGSGVDLYKNIRLLIPGLGTSQFYYWHETPPLFRPLYFAHTHYRAMYGPPPTPPLVCQAPCNIGNGNIV